jgi:hypothetical protein
MNHDIGILEKKIDRLTESLSELAKLPRVSGRSVINRPLLRFQNGH